MIRKFKYPGDPELIANLMFGQEFVENIRLGKPGYIQINNEPPIYFDEVVCDLCNGEIGPNDPCLLLGEDYLYCWDCAKDKLQYLVGGG